MASKNREARIIAMVACPACGAPRGELCRRPAGQGTHGPIYRPMTQYGRPMVCADRRVLWQAAKAGDV